MTSTIIGPSTDWLESMNELVADDPPKPANVVLEPDWMRRMGDLAFPEGESPTDKGNEAYWDMILERTPTIDFSSQSDDALREQILESSGTELKTYFGEVIAAIPRGAANTTIAALAGTVQLAGEAANLVGIDNDVVEWARGIQEAAQEAVGSALPGTPGFEGSYLRKIPEALGSTVPAVGAALAGGIPGLAAFGATVQYSSTYQNARNLGASPADAQFYARVSAVVGGVTEPAGAILPAISILKKANKATGGSLVRSLLKSGGREAVQETIQEIPDETVRQAYLENRTAMDAIATLVETGLIGGIVGILLPGIVIAAKASLAERPSLEFEPTETTDELTVGAVEPGLGGPESAFDAASVAPGETIITDYGNKALLEDYRQRVEAGQKDPTPNAQKFKDVGLPEMTRKQRTEYIERLLEDESKSAEEQARVGPTQAEPGAPTPPTERPPSAPTTGAQVQPPAAPPPTENLHQLDRYKQSRAEYLAQDRRKIGPDVDVDASRRSWGVTVAVAIGQGKNVPEAVRAELRATPKMTTEEIDAIFSMPTDAQAQPPTAVIAPPDGGNSPTSIKNAVVDEERQKRGLRPAMEPARRSFGTVWDEAMRSIEEDPARQDALIRELRDKPRPVFDHEDAMLLHRQVALQNEYDKVLARLDEAQQADDQSAIVELQSQEELLSQELLELYDINKAVGTATSRGLSARKMLANDDFTLARMLAQKRKAVGAAQLSDEDSAAVKDAYQKIANLERRLNEHVTRITELEREAATAEAMKEVKATAVRRQPKRSVAAKAAIEDAWKGFEAQLAGKLFANPLDPELLASAAKLASAYVKAGVAQFQDFFDAVVERIGQAKADKATDILNRAWRVAITEEKPQIKKALESYDDVSRYVRELAEHFISTGIAERGALVQAVHGELSKVIPNITLRETMDAISGYGQFKPLNMDTIKVRLRDLKGQLQQVAKLEDMQAGQAPSKTGLERRAPSDEERRLIQQVNEMKKRGGFEVTDPASQLKSALDAIKTRLKNQIADLEQQIETRQRIIKDRKAPPSDEEAKRLTKRRDALREQFDEIFGRRGLSDEQRVRNATVALERSIEDYKRRIVAGDIDPRPRGTKTPKTAGLEALRVRRDALRAELQHMRDLANPKMTPDERALSALKSSLRRRTADYQDRLARADFALRKRKETVLDREAERLRFQAETAKADYLRALQKDMRKRRTIVQKIFGVVPEALNTSRAIITSMDFSAVLRQGGIVVASHPIRSSKALAGMFKSFISKAGASKEAKELADRPNAALYKRSGLSLTDPFGSLSQQEEIYMSRWSKHIPLVAASERAYVGFLNRIRADTFDAMTASLGRNGSISDAEAKVIANYVNVATGRGNMGRFQAASVPLATVFFAPKYVTSRFQYLVGEPLFRGTVRTKAAIAKEYARTITGVGLFFASAVTSLITLAGPPSDDEDGWNIELDPRSSDFLKIRIGKTRIDPLFGLQQATVFMSRLVLGATKRLSTGDITPIRGPDVPYGSSKGADVVARFLRTKLSPFIGTAITVISGENVIGEPVTPTSVASELTTPLALRQIYDVMLEQGIPAGTALGLLEIFGLSVQTYRDRSEFAP